MFGTCLIPVLKDVWYLPYSSLIEEFFFYNIEFRVKKSEVQVVKVKYPVIKVEY